MENSNKTQTRRRNPRINLPLPVRVEVKENTDISWSEITRFISISTCGAGFEIKRKVQVGQLLLLTAPIPQKLRCFDYSEQQYRVWGLVRYCNPCVTDSPFSYNTGVAFIGKHAPLSYQENPAKLYDLSSFTQQGLSIIRESREAEEPDQIIDRRNPRYQIPAKIYLEILDKNKNAFAYETTVSENISVCGTSIFTGLEVHINDMVRVNFIDFNVSILAKVCNRRIGEDQMPRLHLEFVDRQLPLEGIV